MEAQSQICIPYPIHEVVTHERPHLDELVALLMLMWFGDDHFPGVARVINDGHISYISNNQPEGGLSAAEWLERGRLYVGTGYGIFDEHQPAGNGEQIKTCCSQLVAEYLGVDQFPEWEEVLAYTLQTDLHGEQAESRPDARARLKTSVDNAYRRTPHDPTRVMTQTFDLVLDWVNAVNEILGTVADDLARGEIHEFQQEGRARKLVVLQTDNEFALEGAMANGYDAVIIKNSTGNVQIFTRRKHRLPVRDLACLLRLEERRLADGVELQRSMHFQELKEQGTLEVSPRWHYHQQGGFLLNGSLTHPEVTPTTIPLDDIGELALIAYDDSRWPSDRAAQCASGHCSHSRANPCRWYWMGLQRCYVRQRIPT